MDWSAVVDAQQSFSSRLVARLAERCLDLEPIDVSELNNPHLEHHAFQNRVFQRMHLQRVFNGQVPIHAIEFVMFSRPRFALPIFSMDIVILRRPTLCAADFSPTTPELPEDYRTFMIAKRRELDLQARKRPEWATCFSDLAMFAAPGDLEDVAHFEAHVLACLDFHLAQAMRASPGAASAAGTHAAQQAWAYQFDAHEKQKRAAAQAYGDTNYSGSSHRSLFDRFHAPP